MSHVGICVSDLDRSMRRYCDGLGFEPLISYEIGSEFAVPLDVDGEIDLTSQMIGRDGLMIELLHYRSPGVSGRPSRNSLGMTHLSFNVDGRRRGRSQAGGVRRPTSETSPAPRSSASTGCCSRSTLRPPTRPRASSTSLPLWERRSAEARCKAQELGSN